MDIITISVIATALSMDALTVSVVNGLIIKELKLKHAVLISSSFALFQGIMPLAGWFSGLTFRKQIESYSHWVAFVLLLIIGTKMIYESYTCEDNRTCKSCLDPKVLLIMSIATSMDALAVGITFSLLEMDIVFPVLIISGITFFICFTGIIAANRFSNVCEKKFERFGGVMLIGIGLKIVIENFM